MIEKKKKYKLSDFRYQLPKRFIAQKPKRKREKPNMVARILPHYHMKLEIII